MNNIDHIFYINLKSRIDRFNEINNEFNKIGLIKNDNEGNISSIPERFDAFSTPGFGILGCTISHCTVLTIAKCRNYKNVLIFEDDFTFLINQEEFEAEISNIFDNHVDFDVIFFSYNLIKSEQSTEYPFLQRVFNSSTASCYLVAGHYFDSLINLYNDNIPLLDNTKEHWKYANDVVWEKLMIKDKWYATNTRVGKQRPSFSDNSNEFMDYPC